MLRDSSCYVDCLREGQVMLVEGTGTSLHRQVERQTDTDIQTDTHRQTDRQTDTQTDRHNHRQTVRQTDGHPNTERNFSNEVIPSLPLTLPPFPPPPSLSFSFPLPLSEWAHGSLQCCQRRRTATRGDIAGQRG